MDGLAGAAPLAVAGRGASARLADALGARHLSSDPLTAAAALARDGIPA